MFKQNFIRLCNQKGESPSFVCRKVGITPSTYSLWTDESVPRKATLMRIADYFNVTVDQLLSGDPPQPGKYNRLEVGEISFDLGLFGDVQDQEVDEMTELLQELKTRPEMRMLFSLAKGATKEDVELAVAIIQRMRQSGNGE